jgi:hypothetical protein
MDALREIVILAIHLLVTLANVSTLSSAFGVERRLTHFGVTMTGRWLTRSRMTAKAASAGARFEPI